MTPRAPEALTWAPAHFGSLSRGLKCRERGAMCTPLPFDYTRSTGRREGSFRATREAARDRAGGSLCRPLNLEDENGNQTGDSGPRSPFGFQKSWAMWKMARGCLRGLGA